MQHIDPVFGDDDDVFDPEENFVYWLLDEWAKWLADPTERIQIDAVANALRHHGALDALKPEDPASGYILRAFAFTHTTPAWLDAMPPRERYYVLEMRAYMSHFLRALEV